MDWKTIGDEEGTLIQQAIARYDYILFYKHYSHEDFIDRNGSDYVTQYSTPSSVLDSYEDS